MAVMNSKNWVAYRIEQGHGGLLDQLPLSDLGRMSGRGSTTVISASSGRSSFASVQAGYQPG